MPTTIRNSGGASGGSERYIDVTDLVTTTTSSATLPDGMTWNKVISGRLEGLNIMGLSHESYIFYGLDNAIDIYLPSGSTTREFTLITTTDTNTISLLNVVATGNISPISIIYDTEA